MFRFADTKVNNGSCAAAANRAEATFSCVATATKIVAAMVESL